MKKSLLGMLLVLLLFSSGCAAKTDLGPWETALDNLKRRENYTVTATTWYNDIKDVRITRFDHNISQLTENDTVTYYEKNDGQCYIYTLNQDPEIWIRAELPESDLFFYDYAMIERLNKFNAYFDLGLLRYDAESNTYKGENISQKYVYNGEEHAPISLEIELENGNISCIREVWMGYADAEKTIPCRKKDEVTFTGFSTTEIRLPLGSLIYEEIFQDSDAQ